MSDADVLRGVLTAYKTVMDASWPELHPGMSGASSRWSSANPAALEAELAEYLRTSAGPGNSIRVFWKLGPQFKFGGCNELFARDAGFTRPAELVGLDDFDKRIPWGHQAAKYRLDDEEVFKSGAPKLDILERQQSSTGITWVRAGKTPIRTANGEVVGIFGMYELLDPEAGRKLYAQRNLRRR